ncbi:MAG: hypothetical protein V8Q36_10240 [Anaerotignum sp.]
MLARRKAIDRWRRLAGKETLPLQENFTASDSLEQREERKILLDAVLALGDPDAKIVILKYYFGYPTKKITEMFRAERKYRNRKARRSLAKVKTILEGGAFHEG